VARAIGIGERDRAVAVDGQAALDVEPPADAQADVRGIVAVVRGPEIEAAADDRQADDRMRGPQVARAGRDGERIAGAKVEAFGPELGLVAEDRGRVSVDLA
jgi:hypothetical protein